MRIVAIEEAFSVPGVTPPLSRDVMPISDRWLEEWSRRLADLAELRLADMDAHGVDMQVLSLTFGVEVITDPADRSTTTLPKWSPLTRPGLPGSRPCHCRIPMPPWSSYAGLRKFLF
jgi:hypothetical protein